MVIGKVNDDFFRRAILPNTGVYSPHVVVGPKMGVDAAVLRFGEEYLVVAKDPIFPGPTTSPEDYGWITVHIGASDVAVLGVKPAFMTYTLLLPPGTPDDYTERLVRSISDSARELGIAVVGGQTGFYPAVGVPTIGGITVWGTGREVITPAGARKGDVVVLTKGAAIEATGILASELGERLLAAGVGPDLVDRARLRFREMSVVADAEVATRAGGVHAMHDATEGGVARGLWEVAEASGVGLEIYRAKVQVPADVAAVCNHFGLDPYEVISEGTLVLTCDPARVDNLLEAFQNHGIEAAVCGRVVPASARRSWIGDDGRREPIIPPPLDRFWEVFFNALALKSDRRSPAERALCEELAEALRALEGAGILPLIPEIGSNIAYASLEAREPRDIAAVPGRIVTVKDRVAPTGQPEMGASIYMAGTLLIAREFFPKTRCVMNLRNNARVLEACQKAGLAVAAMPVPLDYRQSDDDFRRDLRAVLSARLTLPDVVDVPDRINLERLTLVFATGLEDLLHKVNAIAERLG